MNTPIDARILPVAVSADAHENAAMSAEAAARQRRLDADRIVRAAVRRLQADADRAFPNDVDGPARAYYIAAHAGLTHANPLYIEGLLADVHAALSPLAL